MGENTKEGPRHSVRLETKQFKAFADGWGLGLVAFIVAVLVGIAVYADLFGWNISLFS